MGLLAKCCFEESGGRAMLVMECLCPPKKCPILKIHSYIDDHGLNFGGNRKMTSKTTTEGKALAL